MSGSRSKTQAEAIHRTFGGIPIRDATGDVRLALFPEDIKGAERKNFQQCVFARACRRTFGTEKILFFGTVAYVEVPDAEGDRHVERLIVPPPARALIEKFDRGQTPEAGTAFVLKAPSKSRQLDTKLRKGRARRKAIAKGTYTPLPGRPTPRSKPAAASLEVRNGTGMVQMFEEIVAA